MTETNTYEVDITVDENFFTKKRVEATNCTDAVRKAVIDVMLSWEPDRPKYKVTVDVHHVHPISHLD